MAGRPFTIKREFLDDVAEHSLMAQVAHLHKALLVMHSPTDDTVGIDNATNIFVAAKHPKSFVSLAGADHLLSDGAIPPMSPTSSRPGPNAMSIPSRRKLPPQPTSPAQVVVRETRNSKFQQTVTVGPHQMLADEPVAAGGEDTGPGPYDFVLAGLGACTSMTMRMYADRKSLPLDRVTVTLKHGKIHAKDCEECETRRACSTRSSASLQSRAARCRSAQATDGNRRQVSGASHADVGNSHRDESGGLEDGPRASCVRTTRSLLARAAGQE